jgi:bifunctional ADP-heptose synthase (sugar kinase/adenylyltransferase)
VQAAGGRVVLVDLVEGRSTTGLIEAMRRPVPVPHGEDAS